MKDSNKKAEIIIKTKKKYISCYSKPVGEYIAKNNEQLNLAQQIPENLINGIEVKNFMKVKFKDSKNRPVILRCKLKGFNDNDKLVYHIYSIDNKYKKEIVTNKKSVYLYNLIPLVEYRWFVSDSERKIKSNIGSFVITSEYRLLYFPKFFNCRDIGGKETIDGKRIKYGLVYRGPELVTHQYVCRNNREDHGTIHTQLVHKCDLPFLKDLNIKTEIDLRCSLETNNSKESPLKTKGFNIDYRFLPGQGYQVFFDTILENDEYRKQVKEIFEAFANADKKPVYIHCWGGADRTGTVCFVLEAMVGVKVQDLIIDYELTSFIGNICRCKPYDENVDFVFRKNWNMAFVSSWLKDYSLKGETIQDTVTRFLVDGCKISLKTIDKIKKIFLI